MACKSCERQISACTMVLCGLTVISATCSFRQHFTLMRTSCRGAVLYDVTLRSLPSTCLYRCSRPVRQKRSCHL